MRGCGKDMIFGEFIRTIHKKGWSIVAMNEYSISHICHPYLVVKKTHSNKCFKVEGSIMNSHADTPYGDLFEKIIAKIDKEESK